MSGLASVLEYDNHAISRLAQTQSVLSPRQLRPHLRGESWSIAIEDLAESPHAHVNCRSQKITEVNDAFDRPTQSGNREGLCGGYGCKKSFTTANSSIWHITFSTSGASAHEYVNFKARTIGAHHISSVGRKRLHKTTDPGNAIILPAWMSWFLRTYPAYFG